MLSCFGFRLCEFSLGHVPAFFSDVWCLHLVSHRSRVCVRAAVIMFARVPLLTDSVRHFGVYTARVLIRVRVVDVGVIRIPCFTSASDRYVWDLTGGGAEHVDSREPVSYTPLSAELYLCIVMFRILCHFGSSHIRKFLRCCAAAIPLLWVQRFPAFTLVTFVLTGAGLATCTPLLTSVVLASASPCFHSDRFHLHPFVLFGLALAFDLLFRTGRA